MFFSFFFENCDYILVANQNKVISFGYKEAGSRVCFAKENHKIKLHKPHPDNKLKLYQLDFIVEELKNKGLI